MHIIYRISATGSLLREWFSANRWRRMPGRSREQTSAGRANLCRSAGELRMFFLIHRARRKFSGVAQMRTLCLDVLVFMSFGIDERLERLVRLRGLHEKPRYRRSQSSGLP